MPEGSISDWIEGTKIHEEKEKKEEETVQSKIDKALKNYNIEYFKAKIYKKHRWVQIYSAGSTKNSSKEKQNKFGRKIYSKASQKGGTAMR